MQPHPGGLAQAFIIGERFVRNEPSALVLGDNLFFGSGFQGLLREASGMRSDGATVFAYRVSTPEAFGVVSFDSAGRATSIEEKPAAPEEQLRRHGPLFLRRGRRRDRQVAEAVRARRARDHRRQPHVSRARCV